MELTAVLSGPSADIKKAGKLIRTDPSLSAQVLRLCNSPMFGLRSRVISIEQATMLVGMERLRSIAMACSLVSYSGYGLPADQVTNFWEHSFLAGMLSEHLAKQTEYCEKEQAYIAGLLHDIGQIPQWMLAVEERAKQKNAADDDWIDNISIERDHFGMDHCEIGRSMALTWNFMPSFIDVLGHHHEPEDAQHDPNLVQIIATIEHFLLHKVEAENAAAENLAAQNASHPAEGESQREDSKTEFAQIELPVFANIDPPTLVTTLETEYERLLPLVRAGLITTVGGTH
jgi:HD-like signal output (HDOD) protein